MADETDTAAQGQAPETVTPATNDASAETEAPAAEATPAAEAAAPAEPVAALTPKERKVAARKRRGRRRPAAPEERAVARKAKAAERQRHRAKVRARNVADREANGPRPTTPPAVPGEGRAKVRQGKVVSAKADKTITVRIETARRHRRYEKIVRSSTTLHAHDENNDAHEGDTVVISETRPMSHLKRWKLDDVVERAR